MFLTVIGVPHVSDGDFGGTSNDLMFLTVIPGYLHRPHVSDGDWGYPMFLTVIPGYLHRPHVSDGDLGVPAVTPCF